MKYYRPIKSNWLVQGFGENKACVATDTSGKAIQPYKVLSGIYPNSCPVNSTKLYPLLGLKGHNGYDLASWKGEPVYHSGDFSGWLHSEIDMGGGIGVDIVSKVPLKECTEGCPVGTMHYIKLRNWHLWEVVGFDKKELKPGDLIGYADSTGISSGDHVHFGPKWCNENGSAVHNDNGYFGAFDPGTDYENVFILDVLVVKQRALTAIELARKVIFEVVKWLSAKVGNLQKK